MKTTNKLLLQNEDKSYLKMWQLAEMFADMDNMIGDLCHDLIEDGEIYKLKEHEVKDYLTNIAITYPETDNAVRRLKTIYTTIYNSVSHQRTPMYK